MICHRNLSYEHIYKRGESHTAIDMIVLNGVRAKVLATLYLLLPEGLAGEDTGTGDDQSGGYAKLPVQGEVVLEQDAQLDEGELRARGPDLHLDGRHPKMR